MRAPTTPTFLIVATAMTLVWAAHGAVAAQDQPASPAPSAAPAAAMPEGTWSVRAYDPWAAGLVEPRSDTDLSVSFLSDGRLEGETGCGRYEGGYFLEGAQLSTGVVSSPFGPCGARRSQESVEFLAALDEVVSWQATASAPGLALLDASGLVRVILQRPGGGDASGEWLVTAYTRPNGKRAEPSPEFPMRLAIRADGTVSGSTGCRFFEGEHRGEGDRIVIGPIELIGLPCEGEQRRPERQLLAAIDDVARWERAGDSLQLIDAFEHPMVELRLAPMVEPTGSPGPDADSSPPPSTPPEAGA